METENPKIKKLIVLIGPTSSGKTSIIKALFELVRYDDYSFISPNKFWKEVLVVGVKNRVKVGLLSKGSLYSQLKRDIDYLIIEEECQVVVVASSLKNEKVRDYLHSFANLNWDIEYVNIVPEFFSRDVLLQIVLNQRAALTLNKKINELISSPQIQIF